jgi:hypothetical protein
MKRYSTSLKCTEMQIKMTTGYHCTPPESSRLTIPGTRENVRQQDKLKYLYN